MLLFHTQAVPLEQLPSAACEGVAAVSVIAATAKRNAAKAAAGLIKGMDFI